MQQLPIIGEIKRSRDVFQIAEHIGNEKGALDRFFRRILLGARDRRGGAIHSGDLKPPARKPHCVIADAATEINRSARSDDSTVDEYDQRRRWGFYVPGNQLQRRLLVNLVNLDVLHGIKGPVQCLT